MRILFIAAYRSNHADRHINLLAEAGFDVHLAVLDPFEPLGRAPLHSLATLHQRRQSEHPRQLFLQSGSQSVTEADMLAMADRALPSHGADSAATWLAALIDRLQPDIVHSFSIHQSSFLTLAARGRCKRDFPRWIVSNWGCDIHFFGRQPDYRRAIAATLPHVNGYFAECARDDRLARELGLQTPTLAIQPIGGGFDLSWFRALRSPGPAGDRRLFMLKGYQSDLGRAVFAFEAIHRLGPALRGYRLAVYGYNAEIVEAVAQVEKDGHIQLIPLPFLPYEDLMRRHGEARCSIGLSESDGICTSAVEAMLMGSVPIQSNTSCLAEWTEPESVLLVPASDPDAVEAALYRALDDDYVNRSVRINDETLRARFSREAVDPHIISMYRRL